MFDGKNILDLIISRQSDRKYSDKAVEKDKLDRIVEAGRMGLSVLLGGTGLPVAEQYISRSAHPVTVTVELPREGATTVLLRNTVETAGRALVLEASLCDRTD